MRHKSLDSADAATYLKFNKVEIVVGRRGKGRIRQAYFSGEILQYDVEGEHGKLFATE